MARAPRAGQPAARAAATARTSQTDQPTAAEAANPMEGRMADETETEVTSTQKIVEMPRAVHELRTGTKPTDVVAPGTIITEAVAKKHGLDDETLLTLVATGAVNLAEVLTV